MDYILSLGAYINPLLGVERQRLGRFFIYAIALNNMALFVCEYDTYGRPTRGIEPGCYELKPDFGVMPHTFLVGKDRHCDLVISHPAVSGVHIKIMWLPGTPDTWHIVDNKSMNGTWVEGEHLKPQDWKLLENSSKIMIANTFKLLWADDCNGTLNPYVFEEGWPKVEPRANMSRRFPAPESQSEPKASSTPPTVVKINIDNQWEFGAWVMERFGRLGLLVVVVIAIAVLVVIIG